MSNIFLCLFFCSIFCGQIRGVLDVEKPYDISQVKVKGDEERPLLAVPELYEDEDLGRFKPKEALTSFKTDQLPLASRVNTSEHFGWYLFDSHEEKIIRSALENLPEKNRPADIELAMRMAESGKKVLGLLQQGRFGDAISMNLPVVRGASSVQLHDEKIFNNALNMGDLEFWDLIKSDPVIIKSVTSHGVSFTMESFQTAEYNMYFRVTYIRKKMQSSTVIRDYRRAYQKSIVQLQWHLFARSVLQDQAFTSGMITFNDPQSRLFNFLDGYAELMSPKYKFYDGRTFHSLWADQAYTRESSHWTGQKDFGGKNFGIDIKDADGKPMSILPGNKSHLLFGMRTNGMTFVKWEEYGVTFNVKADDYSVFHHTLRYFEKKDLEDDPALQRREKVPAAVYEYFKKLYLKTLTKKEEQDIKTNGIADMIKILRNESPSKVVQFEEFLVKKQGYQKSTLPVRKGGEIILTLPDIAPVAKTVKSLVVGS